MALPLRAQAQNYEWGREASTSEVAQLAKANGAAIDESKPFAELWMGTHPNCPSVLASSGDSLRAWIQAHPECLGSTCRQQFGVDLPFLFKVLSVRKALSIQSHPDKLLAERLHAQQPKMYPDNNHKPEMALALSEFEALCGFCPLEELQQTLRQVPELAACVGEAQVAALLSRSTTSVALLRDAFTALMTCDAATVAAAIAAMVSRLEQRQSAGDVLNPKETLALRLNQQYPGGDVGVLSAFFLNYIQLSPGQAIFLPANVPHAYLSGELMECMAASDNVIRAGLTPKFKDTEVLCASLTYAQGAPEVLEGQAEGLAPGLKVYQPPFEEFEIHALTVQPSDSFVLPVSSGPRLLLVQHGAAAMTAKAAAGLEAPELVEQAQIGRGSVLFLPAGSHFSLTAEAGTPLIMWSAAVNSVFLQLTSAMQEAAAAAAAATASMTVLSPKVEVPPPASAAIFCVPV